MSPRRRIALLGALVAALILVGGLALAGWAVQAAAREERLRHEMAAERLFDELERELSALVGAEEARSFLEYRYFYAPSDQVGGGLVRSPLSAPPADGAILAYFQLDPDGRLYTPARPRDHELALAREAAGYAPEPWIDAIEAEIAALGGVDWALCAPPPVAAAAPPGEEGSYARAVQSLNRAGSTRQEKQEQWIASTRANVDSFLDNNEAIQQIVEPGGRTPADPGSGLPGSGPPAPLTDLGAEQVDVVVSPIRGQALGPDRLVLHREVRIGEDRYRQGLVLSASALTSRVERRVLAGSELEPYVALAWGGSPPGSPEYAFSHDFAAPFSALRATAALEPIPGAAGGGQRAILALAGLLAAATLLGAAALTRMVAAELEFARRRGDFVAAVSHELKTPLTAIRMYGEMLRDGIVPSPERRQEYYGVITAEAERLSRLIENVLALARLERGGPPGARVVGDPGAVLAQVAEVLTPHARSLGFSLAIEVSPRLPPVEMDPDALAQVLVNLVDNAVKFSSDAEHKVIVLGAAPAPAGGVRLWVRDRGPGVPARQLTKIFEPFYRGERELTRRTKGTGIGLALVAGLVARMGGQVAARNPPGGGLEVAITLPSAA